jgi:hypothetical protein
VRDLRDDLHTVCHACRRCIGRKDAPVRQGGMELELDGRGGWGWGGAGDQVLGGLGVEIRSCR